MNSLIHKKNIALFIALLFHSCGLIGILCSPFKGWFINNTPITLLIMASLLIITQLNKNRYFYLFMVLCFVVGMSTEMIGVNTGLLFGKYHYGKVLGYQFYGVPLLIGMNWFSIVFCSGSIMYRLQLFFAAQYQDQEERLMPIFKTVSFIFDSATLATLFDYLMEPVAVKLGFWTWQNSSIPFYNYLCWFLISALLMIFFKVFTFNKENDFAVHLYIIQLLFFLALRIYL